MLRTKFPGSIVGKVVTIAKLATEGKAALEQTGAENGARKKVRAASKKKNDKRATL